MLVQRLHLSSYYPEDFAAREQQLVEKLGLQYKLASELAPETQIVLATSQVQWENYNQDQLKLIVHPNSGYDNYSFKQFHNFSAPIIIGNSIRANAVAEYSIACLMQHYCPINWNIHWDASRAFPKRKLISECEILLYGYGHVGSIIAETLIGLGAKVFVSDPFKEMDFVPNGKGQFDAIIMASSLNPSSHEIIDSKKLQLLSPSGCFINAARGNLVKEAELLAFLKENIANAAYLDVTQVEPFNSCDYSDLENIYLTSHISGVHDQLSQKVLDFEQEVLKDFLQNNSESFQEKYHASLLDQRMTENYFI